MFFASCDVKLTSLCVTGTSLLVSTDRCCWLLPCFDGKLYLVRWRQMFIVSAL